VPTQRLPRAVREQQMLDAAVRVFSRLGYHAASVDEIADAAGISKPMVYAYLGTKEELFTACLHREGARLAEAIAAAAISGPSALPPEERLWRGLRAFFGFVADHRDGWLVLYRQARGQQPFAEVIDSMRNRMAEVVAGMLTEAISAEHRRIRARELTTMGYALVGAAETVADWLADNPSEDPEAVASDLMNVIWVGAAGRLAGTTWR
jgi:AcrR family transcriptional regulator